MRAQLHILQSGPFELVASPSEGGLVRHLRWRNNTGHVHDLLRLPFAAGDKTGSPRLFGLWPMVPFANRAFGAVMDDGEERITLPANDPATGSTIHGFGWQSAWEVTQESTSSLMMVHERKGEDDPYHYRSKMTVSLRQDSVWIALSVTNLSGRSLPHGLGLHPWFPARADTRLHMSAAAELVFGAGYRATGVKSLPDGGAYAAGPLFMSGHETAHSFVDWACEADIITPSTGLAVHVHASPSLRHAVVWAPAQADFLCIEPQSHAIGAPGEPAARQATPLARLATGESLSGWVEISPRLL